MVSIAVWTVMERDVMIIFHKDLFLLADVEVIMDLTFIVYSRPLKAAGYTCSSLMILEWQVTLTYVRTSWRSDTTLVFHSQGLGQYQCIGLDEI